MADGDTSMHEVNRTLTDGEVMQRKDELVQTDSEILDLEEQRRATAAEFKGKLEPRRERRCELVKAIETRRETFEVECVEAWDYKRNVVEIKRVDNGEVVDERPMNGEQRQEALDDVDGGTNKGKAARSRKGKAKNDAPKEPEGDEGDEDESDDEDEIA